LYIKSKEFYILYDCSMAQALLLLLTYVDNL